ncbi:reverse transcriptase domain-containing protein [Tanacetum coccineum]
MVHDSMDRVVRQGAKVAKNANNKRKWEGDHGRSSSKQQNKRRKVIRAHTVGPSNKKGYVGTLPNCNRCKLHHTGQCTMKCKNGKRVGHMTRNCKNYIPIKTQRLLVAKQKTTVTCLGCGAQGHFKSDCPKLRTQNRNNQKGKKEKSRGNTYIIANNAND